MALVARYHRRGTPKRSHEEYAQLPGDLRRTVRMLASILRVAESLDRSHAQVDFGPRAARSRRRTLLITLHVGGDAELEVWATSRHLEPFEQLVGKPVADRDGRAATPQPRVARRRHDARCARRSRGALTRI